MAGESFFATHKGLKITGIVVAVLILLVVITAIAGGGGKKAATGTTSTTGPAVTSPATVATTVTATTKPTPTTKITTPTTVVGPIFQMSGNGDEDTASFHVPNEWQVDWTYNCSAFGESGNFEVDVSQPPGDVGIGVATNDDPISQLGTSGSGVQSYPYGGTVFLSVLSECSWTLKVT